jgi:flagellar biosynthesis/type III secretory pathway protein FliH
LKGERRAVTVADTVHRGELDALKKELEEKAKSTARVAPQVSEAIQELITAISYDDRALLDSSLNSLFSCLADVARDIIKREVLASEGIREGIRQAWKERFEGRPCENLDEVKNVIASPIDERMASMIRLRDNLVKMIGENGYPVENAQQLEDGIRELRRFRENILRDWPSPSRQPSPINRKAVAEAREAIARGEKGLRKQDLVWGEPPEKTK